MASSSPSTTSWFAKHPVQQLIAYYAVMALGVFILYQVNPDMQGIFTMERFQEAVATGKKALGEDTGS